MLGTFLEIGIETEDIASTFAAFGALGFGAVPAGDIRGEAYAVVSDGSVCVGLYQGPAVGPTLTFVRPALEHHVRALRRRRIALELANLGEQQFHEVAFRDPSGQLVSLVEARTFSPPSGDALPRSLCGRFLEYSLPTTSIEQSQRFWERLGLQSVAGGTQPHPWRRLQGLGLTLGLHQTGPFRPGPSFTANQLGARLEYLRAKGCAVTASPPAFLSAPSAATVHVEAALPLYLLADPADAD